MNRNRFERSDFERLTMAKLWHFVFASRYPPDSSIDEPTCDMKATICAQKELDAQIFRRPEDTNNFVLQSFAFFAASNGISRFYPGKVRIKSHSLGHARTHGVYWRSAISIHSALCSAFRRICDHSISILYFLGFGMFPAFVRRDLHRCVIPLYENITRSVQFHCFKLTYFWPFDN